MQRKKLIIAPRISLMTGCLLLSLTTSVVWAEGPAGPSKGASPASNIEGWAEDESEDSRTTDWTWFGMGYESRVSGNSSSGTAGSGAGGAGAAGVGAGAAVMNQRGPGRR
jgi:hypothetical protein